MRRTGVLDVLGYGLPATLHDALQEIDLAGDMGSFAGDSFVVQVAKRPGLARDLEVLRDRLAGGGHRRCRAEVIREPAGSTFGSASFVATTGDLHVRTDVMEPLVAELGRLIVGWATE